MAGINRVSGLASGLDVDKIVSDLMKAQRMRLDRVIQDRQIWQWKQEDYRSLNASLLSLRNVVSNLRLQSSFLAKKATSSDEGIVTAAAGTSAAATTYQVKVNQLATVATNVSVTPLRPGIVGTTLTTPLDTTGKNQFKLSYNGGAPVDIILEEKNYDGTAGKTLNDLVADIQTKIDAAIGKGKVMVSLTADKKLKLTAMVASDGTTVPALQVLSGTNDALGILGLTNEQMVDQQTALDPDAPLASQESKFANSFGWGTDHTFSFTINGQTFTFDGDTDSLNKVIATVNANKAAGVSMFYDASTDRIAISTVKTGDNQVGAEIQVKDVTGSFMTGVLQIDEANEKGGTDASFEINGLAITSHTNSYTVNGVTFNFRGADPGRTVTVSVAHDVDAVVNTVKSFVDKYNEVLEAINKKLYEERYPDYRPLTEEQIEEGKLTDRQIDAWQDKARSGLLKGDPLLSGIVADMRSVLSGIVEGVTGQVTVSSGGRIYTTIADRLSVIGITTGAWTEKGKLYLDESRLREALQSNPDAVMELFTRTRDADGREITDDEQKGLAVRLYDAINGAISRLTGQAGTAESLYDNSYISRRIRDINENIAVMEERLQKLEDRYYRQFTALEQAIAAMNVQSMWLTQQFFVSGQ